MGSLSDFAELELLDHVLNVAYVRKAVVYLALCTAEVVDADDGAAMDECTGTGYARVAITFGAAASRKITQSGAVEFPTAGAGGWGTATHWAVMDGDIAASGSEGLRASFSVISFSRNEPLEEAMTVSVTLKVAYSEHPPEWMVIP